MHHCHNLDFVWQFSIEQAIGKRLHAIATNRLFVIRPQFWIALNCRFAEANGIEKIFSKSRLLFIVILSGLGKFYLSHAQISYPFHFTFL